MAEAWATARFILTDQVSARMAFLEVYRERIAIGRSHRRAPRWEAYLGLNPATRAPAIEAAVLAGRLTVAQAKGALPPHEWPRAWQADRALPEGALRLEELQAMVGALIARFQDKARTLALQPRPEILPPADEDSLRGALEARWRTP